MIPSRKLDHILISMEKDVQSRKGNGFKEITFVHRALPEIDKEEIDLSVDFFGRRIKAPIVIAGMTGGHEKALEINRNLALAAQEMGIPMGVGSQRAALEDPSLVPTYSVARDAAPDAFIIANIGAVQFASGYGLKEAERAVDMIGANALAVHLNPLQEALQPEGDWSFKGCLDGIRGLRGLRVPIIAKETGAGIAREEAVLLEEAGVQGIDVGGLGGTSFAAVEQYRQERDSGSTFREWGIPTAVSVIECVEYTDCKVIATGGIRSGLDVAKALALGADACGIAWPLLSRALKGPGEVVKEVGRLLEELRIAMFLLGARDMGGLRGSDMIIGGGVREWLEGRGMEWRKFANRRLVER
ncbi:MAG: type 2 isopentenyl-diphosphate Delta-isomerase [Candidatus Hydrothermarchaeota archaeon]